MSEPAVEEPIKAAHSDSESLGGLGAPDRFGARPQTEPGLASQAMSGMARLGALAAGTPTAAAGSTERTAQETMQTANSMPIKAGLNSAFSHLGAKAPVMDVMHHAGIATQAAAHMAQQASGHDASEVAHDTRAALSQKFDELDEAGAGYRAERAKTAADKAAGLPSEPQKTDLFAPGAKTVRGRGLGARGKYLLAGIAAHKAATQHGEAVQAAGHFSPTETTVKESEMMNGYEVKRNGDNQMVSKKMEGGAPVSTPEGKAAVLAAMPHRALGALGGAVAGDDASEDLRQGNFKTAIAKSALGATASVGKTAAGHALDAHGAAGAGGIVVAGAAKVGGGIVKGLASGIGSVTGLEEAAQRQEIAEKSEGWFEGGRRAELMKGGMNARPKADGMNDAAAGLPDIDFAKKGESYSEGAASADASLKASGWGEKGVGDSAKSGFDRGVRWANDNVSSAHSVTGTIARGVGGALAGAAHGLSAIGSHAVRGLGRVAGGIGGAAKGLWSNVKGHGSKFANAAWAKTKSAAASAWSGAKSAWSGAKSGAAWLGGKIASGASALGGAIASGATSAWSGAKSAAGSAWGGLKSGASWLGDKVGGAASWLKGKVLNSQEHDRS